MHKYLFPAGGHLVLMDSVLLCLCHEQVAASFSLSSSDEKVISRLAEAVCTLALDSIQEEFLRGSSGKTRDGFFNWFPKPKQFMSKDSSVVIFRYADEIAENSKSLLDRFNMVRAKFTLTNKKLMRSAWPSLMHSKLERIGGPEFSAWASEYVPAYRIEIDADRLTDLKFEGWRRTMENKWEVFLTHSQMVFPFLGILGLLFNFGGVYSFYFIMCA